MHRNCYGGWPAFVVSLLIIAGLTALVEQVILLISFQITLPGGTSLPLANSKFRFILEGSGMEKQQFGLAWVAGTSYLAVGVFQGFFFQGTLVFFTPEI